MVYNAMKLFMEINPQLFDDCSHEYTESQNNASAREAMRERKWAAIADLANRTKGGDGGGGGGARASDEVDPVSEDNQKRLDSLKLSSQDGGERGGNRRSAAHERQNSVGSSRSQR